MVSWLRLPYYLLHFYIKATSAALLAEWDRIGRPGAGHGGGDRPEKGKLDIQPEARTQ